MKSHTDPILVRCPWCGEPDYDLNGLKSHIAKGDCEAYNAAQIIRSPFDEYTTHTNE